MTAYYNEIDPLAAAWLRELIANHHIAPGYVDERSIAEVRATDLAGFTQCHFFAGIGVWSAALRGAGWSDDRPVWTGSCPCQPFSGSGKKEGFADPRHLWPELADGSAESLGRVRAGALAAIKEEIDASPMEGEIRDPSTVRTLRDVLGAEAQRVWSAGGIPRLHEAPFLLAFLRQLEEQGWPLTEDGALPRAEAANVVLRGVRSDEALAGAPCERGLVGQPTRECADAVHFLSSLLARHAQAAWGHAHRTYAEIGFPLHVGARSRVARLRGYGNAIVKPLAEAFIEAYLEAKANME